MKKKLKLNDLKVESFITSNLQLSNIKGGATNPLCALVTVLCGTFNEITQAVPGCNTNFNCAHTTNETELTNCEPICGATSIRQCVA